VIGGISLLLASIIIGLVVFPLVTFNPSIGFKTVREESHSFALLPLSNHTLYVNMSSSEVLLVSYNITGGSFINLEFVQGNSTIKPSSLETRNTTAYYGFIALTSSPSQIVFENNHTSNVSVNTVYVVETLANPLGLSLLSYGTLGLFVAGIVVIVYGVIKKPKTVQQSEGSAN